MKTNMNKKLEVRSEKLETNVLISDQWFPARRDKLSAIERPRRATPVPCNLSPVTSLPRQRRRAAFTLVEMLVSLSILIILMAAVGEIFSLAGRTVRVGQATLTAMSSIRAVESQIAHDVKHLDTNGFLVIRQRYYAPLWQQNVQYEPGDEVEDTSGYYYLCQQANITQTGITTGPSVPALGTGTGTIDWLRLTGAVGQYPIWRADQLCFMETGAFNGRTGGSISGGSNNQANTAGLADYLTANKAIVWFGQFSASYGTAGLNYSGGYVAPTIAPGVGGVDPFEKPYWPQNQWVPLGTPPSGQTSGQFYFGREAMLLVPSGGNTFGSDAYTDPFYDSPSNTNASPGVSAYSPYSGNAADNYAAVATSSRLDATYDAIPSASYSLPNGVASPGGVGTIEGYVNSLPLVSPSYTSLYDLADFFCYRYSTLISPSAVVSAAAAGPNAMLNGYFRMTPIMLQGVPSFSVDWTDGAQGKFTGTNNTQVMTTTAISWYGLDGNTPTATTANPDGPLFPSTLGTLPSPIIPNQIAASGNSGAYSLNPVYVFYPGNKTITIAGTPVSAWPKALKITYCVTDPNNRLEGGRFVTQVVNLPQ